MELKGMTNFLKQNEAIFLKKVRNRANFEGNLFLSFIVFKAFKGKTVFTFINTFESCFLKSVGFTVQSSTMEHPYNWTI